MADMELFDKISELSASQREMILLQKIHNESLDRHSRLLEDQGNTLSRLTATVEKHELRSTQLEERTDLLEHDLKPIQKHLSELAGMNKVLKILGILASIGAAIFTIAQITHIIK